MRHAEFAAAGVRVAGGPSDCSAPTDGDEPDVFIDDDDDLIEPRAMSLLVEDFHH